MEFKDKILRARALLNLTQEELAKQLGVSFNTINRWENGKVKPTKVAKLRFDEYCRKNGVLLEVR
ncbi:helix-turn-helix transcriptional regulator [Mycoplasmopsis fermentans]|nr:helix-turn-helix transcriptional regulator [Mycoplasmopsis fermentans]VEU66817.1 transcriptional regulator [Mesomycoplasma conjunctivae]ADN69393.1 putative transcriptional regulator [Mycoplasmopsis fermentans JER]ADV35017.1 Transcriptional regulator, XRE family [Mycoplasmopsis fermentans M64]VEU60007.1 transcriptional regulator [Mycoplasmopsis fermentans]VEU66986.1 transcriptional regulator [Mesomycoplasma conjunctivae]